MIANMDGSRFRRLKNADEEAAWLRETTPQNARNSTKWSLKIFEEWQGARSNKVAANESLVLIYHYLQVLFSRICPMKLKQV